MLQEMRKYTKSWISSAFLGLLALSFGIWGIADIFRGTTDTNAFTLGSLAVPVEDFAHEYHNAIRNNQLSPTPDQAKALGQSIVDQMALRAALDMEVKDLGLTVTDGRVQQEVQSITAFAGFLGTFDHAKFLQTIEKAGFSEDQFIARTRQDLARTQMIRAVEGGFELPAGYGRAIYAYINERRAVQYVVMQPSSIGNIPVPSDAVLAAYVKAHPQIFSTPEYRAVSLAAVRVDTLAPTIAVSDKDIQSEIDANKADYVTPERRTLEQITFKSEDEAKAAKAQLDGGKTFAALAAERKLPADGYQLGDVTQADLDPPRALAFFALQPDQVSAPVKSTFGWVLMHLAKITPGKTTSNDDVKKILQKRLAVADISKISNDYTDTVGGGGGIEEAARTAHMTFVRIPAIDAQGLTPDGKKAIDPVDPELMMAIFKADVGEDGDPFTNANGDLYAVKVEGVTPPRIKPLDQVRAQALALWTAEQKQIALRSKAKALTARANAEHSLAGVAASLGLPVQASDSLSRSANSGVFTGDVVRTIFGAAPGGVVFAPTTDGAIMVARVSGIVHAPPAQGDFEFVRFAQQIGSEMSGDITLTLAKAREKQEGLKVNQKMIDNTVGNSGS